MHMFFMCMYSYYIDMVRPTYPGTPLIRTQIPVVTGHPTQVGTLSYLPRKSEFHCDRYVYGSVKVGLLVCVCVCVCVCVLLE